jgi:hypothetical protein
MKRIGYITFGGVEGCGDPAASFSTSFSTDPTVLITRVIGHNRVVRVSKQLTRMLSVGSDNSDADSKEFLNVEGLVKLFLTFPCHKGLETSEGTTCV